jgi:hypothetical protein
MDPEARGCRWGPEAHPAGFYWGAVQIGQGSTELGVGG